MYNPIKTDNVYHKDLLFITDSLRTICVLSILTYHYRHFFNTSHSILNVLLNKNLILNYLLTYGHYSVQLFWIISGIIFSLKYSNSIYCDLTNFKSYLIIRFSKLYPTHFLTLIFVALFQYILFYKHNFYFIYQDNSFYNFITNLLFIKINSNQGFNGPSWSVMVEIYIYIIFFYLSKNLKNNLSTAFTIISLLLIIIFFIKYNNISNYLLTIISCLFFFYIGILTTFLYNKYFFINLITFSIVLIIVNHFFNNTTSLILIIYNLLILFFGFIIKIKFFKNILNNLATPIAKISYTIYMIHFPIQLLLIYIIKSFNLLINFTNSYFIFFYLILVLIISHILYNKFEFYLQCKIRFYFNL